MLHIKQPISTVPSKAQTGIWNLSDPQYVNIHSIVIMTSD